MYRQQAVVISVWSRILVGLMLSLTSFSTGQTAAPEPPCSSTGKIAEVQFVSFPPADGDGTVKFRLAIKGEGFPQSAKGVHVLFDTKDPAHPLTGDPVAADGKEIQVEGAGKARTEVTRIRIVEGACTVAETKDFSIVIKENPPATKVKQIEIKLEHEKNKLFPNLHSLVLTKEGGDAEGFSDNPHRMTVDLMPSGATDITIVQTNAQKLDLHFVASDDYEPTGAVVTVYDSSDLDARKAIATAVTKKTPPDPNQPKVTGQEIVFLDRSQGVGRLRIFGEGFGDDYPTPPYAVDDYLWNCLRRFRIRGTDPIRYRDEELSDIEERIQGCATTLGGNPDTKVIEQIKTEQKAKKKKEEPGNNLSDLRYQLETTKINLASLVTPKESASPDKETWMSWDRKIREAVKVSIHSRNPDLPIEKAEVVDINDKMIDVYFEFKRNRGFSYPLRLQDSNITIRKTTQKTVQTVKNDKVTGTVTGPKEEMYSVPYQIGLERTEDLVYKYKVLDTSTANTLLGRGISDNFYVLQLSVVNTGKKKVAIPLAAIQAEMVWVRGSSKNNNKPSGYLEGPPTLAPVPLAAVSAYFEAYQKSKGARAIVFNLMDAVTTWATALVPFTGPSFKDAEVFWSGGFVPGVRKASGDLSSQQLQSLTSLSWESSETISANGGSTEKLIYIPRKNAVLGASGMEKVTTAQIANIMGLEVTGYEVTDSEAKAASPADSSTNDKEKKPAAGGAGKKPAETPTTKGSDGAAPTPKSED